MPESTVTAKGQITLPVSVRRELHLLPGTKVGFERDPDGVYRLVPRTRSASELKGAIHTNRQVTIAEMREASGPE